MSDVGFYFYDLEAESFVELEDKLVFGRMGCNVSFEKDTKMSRQHLKIVFFQGDCYLVDLSSTNGVRLNSHPIQQNVKTRIRPGDMIEFGNQRFIYTQQCDRAPQVRRQEAFNSSPTAPPVKKAR